MISVLVFASSSISTSGSGSLCSIVCPMWSVSDATGTYQSDIA
jgi:hypothetical protein